MAKVTKAKTKAAVWAPQSREDVVQAIEELGRCQRDLTAIQTLMNNEIAEVQSRYNVQAAPLLARTEELTQGIAGWCEANRKRLTDDGKVKTHDFGSGTVQWRFTPWSVTLRGVEEIIKRIRKMRLGKKYLREKVEINKQALLDDRELLLDGRIEGVSFKQTEEFIITPIETTLDQDV